MNNEISPEARGFNQLGQTLREARGEESARAVAKRAGISVVYYRALEKGINRRTGRPSVPSGGVAARLADALGLDKELFLKRFSTDEPISIRMTPEEIAQQAILGFNSMARQRREVASGLVKSGIVRTSIVDPLTEELRRAEAYEKVAIGIQSALNKLHEDLETTDTSVKKEQPN